MSAEWQKIGGVEVCEGTDGATGVFMGNKLNILYPGGEVTVLPGWSALSRAEQKEHFEAKHCQPRHRLIECDDGAVMVLSVDEVDGKPRRGAMVTEVGSCWWVDRYGKPSTQRETKPEAVATAIADVTAR